MNETLNQTLNILNDVVVDNTIDLSNIFNKIYLLL